MSHVFPALICYSAPVGPKSTENGDLVNKLYFEQKIIVFQAHRI